MILALKLFLHFFVSRVCSASVSYLSHAQTYLLRAGISVVHRRNPKADHGFKLNSHKRNPKADQRQTMLLDWMLTGATLGR